MCILSDNIGVIRKSIKEFYRCNPGMNRRIREIVNEIINKEYPIEDMPTIREILTIIISRLHVHGYVGRIKHSNIDFVEVYDTNNKLLSNICITEYKYGRS